MRRRALDDRPADAALHARLAQMLCFLDDLDGAVEQYETIKRVVGDDPLVESNLGIVLTLQGRLDAAMDAHRRALGGAPEGLTPLRVILLWNTGLTLLASGRLREGWDAYEARIPLGLGPRTRAPLPEWGVTGDDPRSVLVVGEQGVGDEVLFGSCLSDLPDGAGRVYVECDPRLVSLLSRSFPKARVGPHGTWSAPSVTASPGEGPEAYIAAGSLPRRYRRDHASFPADGAYLRPDPEKVAGWRARLANLPCGIKVGISWRSVRAGVQRRRDYATLRAWAPILRRSDMQFVNLQYGDCERELLDVERQLGITIHRWDDLDLFDDLEGVAALIAALGIVVAPRNAVAHLAGAVGTKTVMLANPYTWSDLGTGSLPWFPAVTPVYRAPGGTWDSPIEKVAGLLVQAVDPPSRIDA